MLGTSPEDIAQFLQQEERLDTVSPCLFYMDKLVNHDHFVLQLLSL